MYKGFFGLVVLTLLIGAHCVYLWHGRREKKPTWSTGRKVWLLLAAALYVCALAAGLVVVLTGQDDGHRHDNYIRDAFGKVECWNP